MSGISRDTAGREAGREGTESGMSLITNTAAATALNGRRLIGLEQRKTTERLSGAKRINRGADDPSGLGISSRFKGQIRGYNVAIGNCQEGINMLRTMDAALGTVQEILMRMRNITIRAANEAPLTNDDRSKLNDEMQSLKGEVTRTAEASVFNTKHLLTGGAEPGKYKITYSTSLAGAYDIYLMNDDGTDVKKFNQLGSDVLPVLSPDGSKIAFSTNRDGPNQIYVMKSDGSNPKNISNFFAPGVGELYPSWSPDGSKIVFYTNRDGDFEIFVMDTDGGNQAQLTYNASSDIHPRWSPDGSKIAFSSNRDGNYEIYIMNSDGSNPTRITNNPAADATPIWSPDGTRIGFRSTRDGDNEIYTMDIDGSNIIQLTDNTTLDSWPSWSPDGTKIAFTTNRDGNPEIYTMNSDGSNPTNITNNPADDSYPSYGGVISEEFLQVGPDNGDNFRIKIRFPDARAYAIGISGVRADTVEDAQIAIANIDKAISKISEYRTYEGTMQKRLEHIVNENSMNSISMNSSNSKIEDADMAAEAADMARESIKEISNLAALSNSGTLERAALDLIGKQSKA